MFDGIQLFSWPGTGSFRFQGLNEMTGDGTSGSGDFGPFAASFLADSDPASVRFQGLAEWAGQAVAEYTYRVPLESSHYQIGATPQTERLTAYQGTAFVSPDTGDLRRLAIEVPRPPAGSGLLNVRVDITYRANGGAVPELFPGSSIVKMSLNSGEHATIKTTYRDCRLFSGESTIRFEDPSRLPFENGEPANSARLPAGHRIRSLLLTSLDSRTTSAGDSVLAGVLDPIRQGNQVLVPRGAVLHGRLVELERRYLPRPSVRIMIRFDTVEFDGKSVPVALASRGPGGCGDVPRNERPEASAQHVATIWVSGPRIRMARRTPWCWETQ